MDEIICTIPINCGESDCSAKWHLQHYWIHADGEYTICDSDGNHEPCESSEVPSDDQVRVCWNEYYQYVVETGLDPVREFVLPGRKRTRQWQARIRLWIGADVHGLKVTGVRRRCRGEWIDVAEAPKEVREYLLILDDGPGRACIKDYKGFRQMQVDGIDIKMHGELEGWLAFTVDEPPAPWSEARTANWLKRRARTAVKQSS